MYIIFGIDKKKIKICISKIIFKLINRNYPKNVFTGFFLPLKFIIQLLLFQWIIHFILY